MDWLVLDNDIFRILEITYAQLVTTNIYYRTFGKLIKDLFYLENFEVPVVEGFFLTKVVKMPSLLFFTNGCLNRSFGFMKYSSCFKITQALSLLLVCYILCFGCFGFMKDLLPLWKSKSPFNFCLME